MNRRFSSKYQRTVIYLQPGEFVGCRNGPILTTILGSCVATCLMDEKNGISGMNHFMLPRIMTPEEIFTSEIGRYGMFAMELLLGEMIKLGADRHTLKAKVFGGANMLQPEFESGIAEANIDFVRRFLTLEHIPIVAEHVGGAQGRKIVFFTDTGKVFMRLLQSEHSAAIARKEARLADRTPERPSQQLELWTE